MPSRAELHDRWLTGDFAACEALATSMSATELLRLATEGLSLCCAAVGSPPRPVLAVIHAGQHDWTQGHLAFNAVRALTLEAERQKRPSTDPSYLLLFVAENAARVIYNASSPRDPFDSDSAAWLLRTMAQLLRCLPAAERERLAGALAR